MEDIKNKIGNTYEIAKIQFSGIDNNRKFIILIAIIIAVLVLYYIWRYHWSSTLNDPLFLTSIDQNEPFNARNGKFNYTYNNITTSYIPTERIPEISTQNTYSFWIFIDAKQWNYRISDWKHVLHRGDDLSMELKNAPPAKYESPGFWITPQINQLNCIISTLNSRESIQGDSQPQNLYEQLVIEDIELSKWTHIAVVINRDSAALYRNGLMETNKTFRNPIMINKDNLFISQLGGFGGNLAYLRFIPSAMNASDLYAMYKTDKKQIDRYVNYVRYNPKTNKYPDVLLKDVCSIACKNKQKSNQQSNGESAAEAELIKAEDATKQYEDAAKKYGSVPTPIADTSNSTGAPSDYTNALTGNLNDVKSYLIERTM